VLLHCGYIAATHRFSKRNVLVSTVGPNPEILRKAAAMLPCKLAWFDSLHTYTLAHRHTHPRTRTHIYTYIIYTHTHTHTHKLTQVCTCLPRNTHTYTYTYAYTYTYTHVHMYRSVHAASDRTRKMLVPTTKHTMVELRDTLREAVTVTMLS
jgi:adenine C2-methylase RlmN of 23S rRNA A2503 and tRNA A37